MLLRHIHYFLAVAEHRSFTRAATALHVSQPALSQQIKQLEETLGSPLFDRSGREMRLTDAGETYRHYAKRALRDLAEGQRALNDVENLRRGALHIAINPTFTHYLMGPLIASFHHHYPDITLEIREMPQEQIEQNLADDRVDLGIGFDVPVQTGISAQTLFTETLALVVASHHPQARHRRLPLAALDEEKLVLLTAEFATRRQIDHCCRKNNLNPQVLMQANSLSAVIEIIRRTRLASLLPAMTTLAHPDLVSVELTPPLLERTAVLLQRKGGYQTAAARAFAVLAQEQGDDFQQGQA